MGPSFKGCLLMTPKQRRARFETLEQYGCVVCRREYGVISPAEIHHLKGHPWSSMGKRASDEHTIPLCPVHHRHGSRPTGDVGYHQSPREFEQRYGSQAALLQEVNSWVEVLP